MTTTAKRPTNPWAKRTTKDAPHHTIVDHRTGFEYRILKLYKKPSATLKDPYARVYLATSSPYTYGSFELGDGYVREVPGLTAVLRHMIEIGEAS